MSNFMDIEDDDSLMHSKEFIELATQDTRASPSQERLRLSSWKSPEPTHMRGS